jgi:hypothetical protein
MYDDVDDLENNGGVDHSTQILALQTAANKILSSFTTSTLKTMFDNLTSVGVRLPDIPILLNSNEPLTWWEIISAVKMILELQQTISNIISQLNAQSRNITIRIR